MKKRIYIAGPISKGNLADNVNQATRAFIRLAKLGFAPHCPHWSVYSKECRSGFYYESTIDDLYQKEDSPEDCYVVGSVNGNDEMTHDDWMGIDLPWVAVSDAVLRLPGESKGADMEVACARERGIPVFHSIDELLSRLTSGAV